MSQFFDSQVQLILYKDNANERKESWLLISRVQLILYKDNANERKESLLLISRVQLILYKDNANERKESWLLISRVHLILCKGTPYVSNSIHYDHTKMAFCVFFLHDSHNGNTSIKLS